MNAIVNVKKNANNTIYNGKTYQVLSLNRNGKIVLRINGNAFEFEKNEVLIVDIVTEAMRAYKFRDENNDEMSKRYYDLWAYIKERNIIIPPYNMFDCRDLEWESL